MVEEDFESKKHVTRHLTLGRFGRTEEATRINSWPEQDYLHWKLFLARTLTPENVTPDVLETIYKAGEKYRKTYGSYRFGIIQGIKSSWVFIMIAAIIGLVLLLYFSGYIQVR